MIIKLIGIAIVLISSSLIGCCIAECMASRQRELVNLSEAVSLMMGELTFTEAPVRELVAQVYPRVKGLSKEVFACMLEQLENGNDVPKAWETAIERKAMLLSLKREDVVTLKDSSQLFDAYGLQEQRNRLSHLKGVLISLAAEAEEYKKKNSRMVRMLGIYGGALLCVMIF